MRKWLALFLLALPVLSLASMDATSAKAVYKKMIAAVGKSRAVEGTARMLVMGRSLDFKFRLLWPACYVMDEPDAKLLGTGDKHYLVMPGRKQYVDEGERYELPTTLLIGLAPLLKEQDDTYSPTGTAKLTTFQNSKVYAVEMKSKNGPQDGMTIYVDPKTFYPAGAGHVSQGKSMEGRIIYLTIIYTKLNFKAKLQPSDFAWSPPADYKNVGG